MQTNYIATCIALDGSVAYRVVRAFGMVGAAAVWTMLEAQGLRPREVARAPDGATLSEIVQELDAEYRVMYLPMDKKRRQK